MRGNGNKALRLRLMGVPLAAAALLVSAQVDVEPARYPAVTGEVRVQAAHEVGGLDRTEPIRLTTTAVGLTWPDGDAHEAAVRVSDDGETWGAWVPIHADDHRPDTTEASGSAEESSEAVYTGGARWVQFQFEGGEPSVAYVDTTGSTLDLKSKLKVQVDRLAWSRQDRALASPAQPDIQSRSVWGGDACVGEDVSYSTRTRAEVIFVHHTLHSAASNGYGPDEVADLLYAMCAYHVDVRGWHDIGYNTLIDQYGRIWEGRGGGQDLPVRGAHAAGFNSSSIGVAFIGDHELSAPSALAQDAFVDFAAWRMDVAHIDPRSVPVVISRDSPTYPDGVAVPLRSVSGHRDVSPTGCPGTVGYSLLNSLAERIALVEGPRLWGGWPAVDPVPGNRVEGYEPTEFAFQLNVESDWHFTLEAPDGTVLVEQRGTGLSAAIPWDPDEMLEWGRYTAAVTATPVDGSPAPRPASFTFTLGDFTPPFFDDEESPQEWAIDRVYQLGITTGCDDLRFCPLGDVERWQMALFLTRVWDAVSGPSPAGPAREFVDLEGYSPETVAAVGRLSALGITSGISETEFAPHQPVTRWQMALFLHRLLTGLDVTVPETEAPEFTDVTDPAILEAVADLYRLGVTTGTSEATFSPNDIVTREQMAAFLARSVTTVFATESPDP